jgi:spore coat protein A
MNSILNAYSQFSQYGYTNDLPLPQRIDTKDQQVLNVRIDETEQFLGLRDAATGEALWTPVWGYGVGSTVRYPGPTIVAHEDQPVTVAWRNDLPIEGHLLAVDTSIHRARPIENTLDDGFIPTVTHLHGGHTEAISDGGPEQWVTQDDPVTGRPEVGPDAVSEFSNYANDQQGTTLWYHDHALGMTRLNVYTGLAGFYLLEDDTWLRLKSAVFGSDPVLPGGTREIEVVVQDRAFSPDGHLFYPAHANDPLPDGHGGSGSVAEELGADYSGPFPSALPEFFGDHNVVNGMAWPNLDVAGGDLLVHVLNGADSRFYVLQLDNPDVGMTLVGTDTGLLPEPITLSDGDGVHEQGERFVLAPADRVDLVLDFSRLSDGDTAELVNVGPAYEPFKGMLADGSLAGDAAAAQPDDPVHHVLQFTVDGDLAPLNATVNDGGPVVLDAEVEDWTVDIDGDTIADRADNVRTLGLFEGEDPFGRVNPLLGTAEAGVLHSDRFTPDGDFGPLAWAASETTETPLLDTYEQWNIVNFTEDSHPIHIHLTPFQVLGKFAVEFEDHDEDGIPDDVNGDGMLTYGVLGAEENFDVADILVSETPEILAPEDTGWQDTVHVGPEEMLSVVTFFDRPGEYVWHCHILSHEDHDMMRPIEVVTAEADMWN